PRPDASLSPYTTLFRSRRTAPPTALNVSGSNFGGFSNGGNPFSANVIAFEVSTNSQKPDRVNRTSGRSGPPPAPGRRGERSARKDRKSTRLNSSHVAIS